jgi:hypothetical protein
MSDFATEYRKRSIERRELIDKLYAEWRSGCGDRLPPHDREIFEAGLDAGAKYVLDEMACESGPEVIPAGDIYQSLCSAESAAEARNKMGFKS